jgi:hypothetical protein
MGAAAWCGDEACSLIRRGIVKGGAAGGGSGSGAAVAGSTSTIDKLGETTDPPTPTIEVAPLTNEVESGRGRGARPLGGAPL